MKCQQYGDVCSTTVFTQPFPMVLTIEELNAQIIFLTRLLYSSTCFEHCCAHHQEVKFYYTASGIVTLCGWPSGAQVRTGRPPTECDNTRCCIIKFDLLMMSTTVLETCRGI